MAVSDAPRGRRRKPAVKDAIEEQVPTPREEEEPRGEETEEESSGESSSSGGGTLRSELVEAVREAALEVLKPVARKATSSAAKVAVTRGPDLVKDRVMPKVTEKVTDAGGAGSLAKGALGAAGGMLPSLPGMGKGKEKGKKAPTGTGRGRRLPIQESVDVAVDIQTAYDQWTQFEEFPRFMHRVEKVEQRDDTTLMWHENIWGIRRSWEAEITDQDPCRRIAWRSTDGTQTTGVVTFHELADNLTRIQVSMDWQPQGVMEKAASGLRISRRAMKSDLMRFKAYIEMRDEATGEWRGRIEEGELVEEPGAEGEEMEAQGEDMEARGEEMEPEAGEEMEPEADEEREQPRSTGRFARRRREEPAEEEEEYEEEEDVEPEAYEEDAEEEPEQEEELEEEPRPKRRTRATGGERRR